MSGKQTFNAEIEIKSSPKAIFPYISSADGLERWYADKVNVLSNNVLDLTWDGEQYFAKIRSTKQNKYITLEFLDEDRKPEEDPGILTITIDKNELTNTVYLAIEDYTDTVEDQQEFEELWEGLVDDLRDVIGA